MESGLDGVDVVFHLADYHGHMPNYAKFFHSNVVSTALLFEVIREKRLPVKVVIASSQAVYGEGQYYCAYARTGASGVRGRSRNSMGRLGD